MRHDYLLPYYEWTDYKNIAHRQLFSLGMGKNTSEDLTVFVASYFCTPGGTGTTV
jgi:hypothetical protein